MTDRDKTQDQLLSSIRKNKPAAKAAPRKKASTKAAPRKATASRPAAKREAKAAASGIYEYGRRVWPD